VPKANVIGEIGKGYKIAIETLNEGASESARRCWGSLRARSTTRWRTRSSANNSEN
jgi:alkylation response protein AidB-like acyl-CoA dehydrogenase